MDVLAPFRIPAAAFKADEASYEWTIGNDFLALFDEVHEGIDGQFDVQLELYKSGGIITADFIVKGGINTTCDTCSASIFLPIESDFQVMFKFGNPDESTDEVIFIDEEAPNFEAGQLIYDFVMLSVPISHRIQNCQKMENPPCDFTILKYLSENVVEDQPKEEKDSPWDDLKKIIDN
jgi:uncharacterized metal-binding protein YceD (DUF177 family)